MRHFFFMVWFFLFFLVSGFCSILYEVVWLRLAMAQFGVTTALTSIVLSTFMAGLGLGSWSSGRLIRKYENRIKIPAIRLYALAELLIGISAVLVPFQLLWGRKLLERMAVSSSAAYYLGSGIWLALTLIPWCACMGATIPLAMLAIRKWRGRAIERESERSFSYLYLANVLGALVGATIPLLLVELYGFRNTLKIGAACNSLLALSAVAVSMASPESQPSITARSDIRDSNIGKEGADQMAAQLIPQPLLLLFLTGLTSMAMEVVWIRQFTPYLGTVVYAFASILATYLVSTFLGLQIYRMLEPEKSPGRQVDLGLARVVSRYCRWLRPIPTSDLPKLLRLVVGIAPFSACPGIYYSAAGRSLVGRRSGQSRKSLCSECPRLHPGTASLRLPASAADERALGVVHVLAALALDGLRPQWFSEGTRLRFDAAGRRFLRGRAAGFGARLHRNQFRGPVRAQPASTSEVLRDNTATIVAAGEGRNKILLVNGVGITGLTPITKFMAHLPLAFLDHPPKNALDGLLRHGHNLPFAAFLGHSGDRGGVGPERSTSVRVLPRRWSRTAAFATVPRGD